MRKVVKIGDYYFESYPTKLISLGIGYWKWTMIPNQKIAG